MRALPWSFEQGGPYAGAGLGRKPEAFRETSELPMDGPPRRVLSCGVFASRAVPACAISRRLAQSVCWAPAQDKRRSSLMAKKSEATGSTVGATISSKKKRIRKIFGDIHEVVQMPNLIEVQRESYEQFLR